MITIQKILKAIGNKNLDLVRSNGYCYFVYDDGSKFETHSVYVNSINQLSLDSWVQEGKDFAAKIEA